MVKDNKDVVANFVTQYFPLAGEFSTPVYDSKNYAVGSFRKHCMVEIGLDKFIEFFTDYKTGDFSDMMMKAMSLRYFQYLQTVEEYKVIVIFMSQNIVRKRTVSAKKGTVWHVELFQGRNTQEESEFYCGDTNLFDKNEITVQVHHLTLSEIPLSEYDKNETYAIAIHLPERLQAVYNTTLTKKQIDQL
jgi:predicted SnoaL-like aldol condensation-catalyzing enzyme